MFVHFELEEYVIVLAVELVYGLEFHFEFVEPDLKLHFVGAVLPGL